jgi:hypothetical protein
MLHLKQLNRGQNLYGDDQITLGEWDAYEVR